MPRSHLARLFILLFVVAALAAPPAWAAPRSQADIFARAWDFLASLWSAAGCIIDPHGGCRMPTADAGCILDPHGGCATAEEEVPTPPPTTDEGCILDPHGGCRSGS